MRWVFAAFLAVAPPAAHAEVITAGSNAFRVRHSVQLVSPPAAAYSAFGRLGNWWSAQHTYSGNSGNLSLSLSPGRCFCERLPDGGGIEHMRVTYVEPGKRVVMTGSLGPLLYEATTGVMDIQFERVAGGSRVTMDYRVVGFANGGAEKLAPLVDSVLADQMRRYRQFARAQPLSR